MKKHQTSFGVFKPVDHVLISVATPAACEGAAQAMLEAGFSAADIERYTPEEMRLQAEFDIQNASALASLGQELNLVKAHRDLALLGQCFVLVHAPEDEQVRRISEVAALFHATRAQHYGSLMIDELVAPGVTQNQTAESPDKGLDAHTPSGIEGARGKAAP